MNILHEIAAYKKQLVQKQKALNPIYILEQSKYFNDVCMSMTKHIKDPLKDGIIAEFKRKSPSKPNINNFSTPTDIAHLYSNSGASGMSVLTDHKYFGGSNEDLLEAKKTSTIPLLRKDFIVDEYQIIEAKSIGADTILLIADILTKAEVKTFTETAQKLGMEVLFEIHTIEEYDKFHPSINLLGVNNRNLKTFEVNLQTSLDICLALKGKHTSISESGIKTPEDIKQLKEAGFDGFLIGESFMKSDNPTKTFTSFINALKSL